MDVETGLQYNRARYYDSSTGRWMSQDPLGFDAGDSNLYRYVKNQPTVATDPSGFQGWALWAPGGRDGPVWMGPVKRQLNERDAQCILGALQVVAGAIALPFAFIASATGNILGFIGMDVATNAIGNGIGRIITGKSPNLPTLTERILLAEGVEPGLAKTTPLIGAMGGMAKVPSAPPGIASSPAPPVSAPSRASMLRGQAGGAPRAFGNISELPVAQRAVLETIWTGEQPITALPLATRQQLAGLYSRVASENPAGFAQAAFNQARADYLLGRGPNPGPSVVEFAQRMGIPVFRRGGGQ
jgi:RHS repeat-associated protein